MSLKDLTRNDIDTLQWALADYAEHDVYPEPTEANEKLLARIAEMAGVLNDTERRFNEAVTLAVALDIPLRTIANATQGRASKDRVRTLALECRANRNET
jgi:hypothetical protein